MDTHNISERIIEYLDGELPISEESELFSALSQSEELRTEMREHLQISRSISKDTEALVPPPNALSAISSALGIGSGQPTEQPIGNAIVPKSSLWQRFRLPMAFALVASLITFTITYFAMNSNDSQNILSSKAIVQTPPVIVASSGDDTQPTAKDKHRRSLGSMTIGNQRVKSSTEEYSNPSARTDNSELVTLNSANEVTTPINLNVLDKKQVQNSINPPNSNNNYNFELTNEKGSIGRSSSLIIRGMSGRSFPNPDVETQNTLLFSNMSAGLYFTQWNNIKFGIEFGRESFGLRYKNIENNIAFYKEQKPTIYWAAVGFDYSLPYKIFNGYGFEIQPFVDILAGGSQIGGPLLKFITGLRLNPNTYGVGMFLGLEGSMLFYQNQSKFYLSRKLGLTYGLSINF
jgi:hypothetical protein